MKRVLVIDQDRPAMQRLGLQCLERGVGVRIAENVCEGMRAMLSEVVSVVVVDAALLRLTPWEHARLFERVAPRVPVVVVVRDDAALETRVEFEVEGFRVLTRPVTAEDLIHKTELG